MAQSIFGSLIQISKYGQVIRFVMKTITLQEACQIWILCAMQSFHENFVQGFFTSFQQNDIFFYSVLWIAREI